MLLAVVVCVLAAVSAQTLNNNPVIGILTQPWGSDPLPAYIAASYVKYLESAGAQVIPLFYDAPLEETTTLFGQINGLQVFLLSRDLMCSGVLFTGGGTDISLNSTFMITAQHIYNLALEANNKGDYFPLWVCLTLVVVVVVV
jgi:gamma-glutamyl hydrolase